MANTGSVGIIEDIENFLTDNVSTGSADGIKWANSSDGGTAFVRAAAAGKGIHLSGITAATDDHLHELCSDTLDTYVQDGYNMLEVLFQLDVVTTVAINIGFNDDVLDASNTLPAELSTTTWTTNAATFVGLVFDVDATNDDVHCMWVDDDADTSTAIGDLRMKGASLQADKWMMARVELQDQGSGKGARATFTFAVDGKTFSKTFETTIDRDVALCPYIGFENRDAVAHTMLIKYIKRAQSIAD